MVINLDCCFMLILGVCTALIAAAVLKAMFGPVPDARKPTPPSDNGMHERWMNVHPQPQLPPLHVNARHWTYTPWNDDKMYND